MIKLFNMVFGYCCFGRAVRKEQKLINRIKEDILILTKEELDHLKIVYSPQRNIYIVVNLN